MLHRDGIAVPGAVGSPPSPSARLAPRHPANRAKSLSNETIPHLCSMARAARSASFTRFPAEVRGCSRPRKIRACRGPGATTTVPSWSRPGPPPRPGSAGSGDQSHEHQQRHPGQAHGLAAGQRRVQPHPGSFVVLGVGVDRLEQDIGVDQSHEPSRIRRSNSSSSRSPAKESARSIFTAL